MFPQIFGKYVLERELASGGMARVFLATLRGAGGFEKRLVVKQIRPELASDQSFIQRFVAEAKTTVDLSHANIVPVYELGAEQGIYYIAMEYCAGVSLAELLASGPVSPSEGAYIGVEICRALDYAHRKAGVVHRDVTPRNVMIDVEGMVKLIDFGIAAPVSASSSAGPLFGSLGHMPPEQLRPGPLTPAADVFAVAVLLIEAWTGRAPFRRESFEACARALAEPPPRLGHSQPALAGLEPLIEAALAHAPERRPQSAEELARPLREFLRQDDLGDIARRLGARVGEREQRLAREQSRPPGASLGVESPVGLGARGAPPASATQTFATREVSFEWTAKIESTPPRPAEPALAETLEIGSGVVAPSEPGAARPEPGRRRHAPARAAAFALTAVALLGLGLAHQLSRAPDAGRAGASAHGAAGSSAAAGAGTSRGASVSASPHGALASSSEPLALGPLVPAADALAMDRAEQVAAAHVDPLVTGPAGTARAEHVPGLAAGGVPTPAEQARPDRRVAGAIRSAAAGMIPSAGRAHGARSPTAATVVVAGAAPGAASPAAPVPAPLPAAPAGASPSAVSSPPAVSSPAPGSAERGRLAPARAQLTAEPGAWVEVDGVRVGRTPLRQLALAPGRHTLSFVSQLLGERLDANVNVEPEGALSVHADFTSASPQLYVR